MNKEEFTKLIDKEKYQVFLFKSNTSLPSLFATHSYFVITKKGKLMRYEIAFEKNKQNKKLGHFHINTRKPTQGIEIIIGIKKWKWDVKLIDNIKGGEDSIAKKMINVIEESSKKYKNKHYYKLLGPNCNTYTQWIIDQVPECKFKLPRNSTGKNWKK